MKDEHKKSLLEKYKIALQKGERFWPDSIYKDLVISLAVHGGPGVIGVFGYPIG